MKTLRKVIEIDETLCNGCGDCIIGCPEGAIQLVEGKARLVSDTYCDGLGACVGECPVNAIRVIEREAAAYDERLVIANIMKQGPAAVQQHLNHLRDHGELEYLAQAEAYLKEQRSAPSQPQHKPALACGCPGSAERSFKAKTPAAPAEALAAQIASAAANPTAPGVSHQTSSLTHWPVQMHLINPQSPHFHKSDFLLAADCVAFSLADFHSRHLKGRTLGIACPKLDQGKEIYGAKIQALVEQAQINTLTVMIMQVPCCQGLLRLAQQAVAACNRKVPIKALVVGVEGDILNEEWI